MLKAVNENGVFQSALTTIYTHTHTWVYIEFLLFFIFFIFPKSGCLSTL